jgi:hypothetical protein
MFCRMQYGFYPRQPVERERRPMADIVRFRIRTDDPLMQAPIDANDRQNFVQQIQMSVRDMRQKNLNPMNFKIYNVEVIKAGTRYHFTLDVDPVQAGNDLILTIMKSTRT